MKRIICLIVAVLFLAGCAATPKVAKGMTKDQVKVAWGDPDSIKNSKNSCCRERNEEAWHYFGSSLPFGKSDKSVVFSNDQVKYVFIY